MRACLAAAVRTDGLVCADVVRRTCHISRVAVHANYRNLGIEQRLVDGIEQAFRETASFEALTWGDGRNLAVYKTLGYEIDKEKKLTNGLWMVSLTKGSSYS